MKDIANWTTRFHEDQDTFYVSQSEIDIIHGPSWSPDNLILGRYRKLNTVAKRVYDALKLIVRNAFYIELAPFKKSYDNYRDEHAVFRNLTRTHGLLATTGSELKATLSFLGKKD